MEVSAEEKEREGSEEKSEQLFLGIRIRARNLHLGVTRKRHNRVKRKKKKLWAECLLCFFL